MSEQIDPVQRKFRDMAREISKYRAKSRAARDLQIAAQTRAHDLKLRAKSAEYGLRGLLQRCEKNELALSRHDTLLRRWLNWDTRDGLLTQLCEDTQRELEGKP